MRGHVLTDLFYRCIERSKKKKYEVTFNSSYSMLIFFFVLYGYMNIRANNNNNNGD